MLINLQEIKDFVSTTKKLAGMNSVESIKEMLRRIPIN